MGGERILIERLTIVGLGLMGGSFAYAARPVVGQITAVDPDPTTRQTALTEGLVERATADLAEGVAEAELIILATPVKTIVQIVKQLPQHRPDGCFVLDLGSTKTTICAALERFPPTFATLGGHPMCGRESSGLAAATLDLYQGQTFALVPTGRTTAVLQQLAHELVTAIGARPLLITAAEHDRLVALTSHLPYLLAATLMEQAGETAVVDERVWPLSASGFRDTSRLSGSSPQMMADILATNREAVAAQLAAYQTRLAHWQALLAEENWPTLQAELATIQDKFKKYKKDRSRP